MELVPDVPIESQQWLQEAGSAPGGQPPLGRGGGRQAVNRGSGSEVGEEEGWAPSKQNNPKFPPAVLIESSSNGKCRHISGSKQVFVSSLSCTGRLLHPSQDAVLKGHITVGQS